MIVGVRPQLTLNDIHLEGYFQQTLYFAIKRNERNYFILSENNYEGK